MRCLRTGIATRCLVTSSAFVLVHRFTDLHRRLAQPFSRLLQRFRIGAFQSGLGSGHSGLGLTLLLGAQLVAVFLQVLLDLMDQAFGVVARLDRLTPQLVGFGVGLGFLYHALDVGFRQTSAGLDADLLLLAGG